MAIDSVFSVSTTGSQINNIQRSAEDRAVEKPTNDSNKSSTSSETNAATPVVNTEGQKTGTTINTTA